MLKDAGIKASESLFLDDAEANVETARKLGFKTCKVNPEDDLILFFEKNSYLD
jgi:FMN phosphatase YigB (HAD superfamily)